MRRRGSWQQREREFQREVAEQRARAAYERERAEYGAFIMEADEHRLALIEQFGATAVRVQLAENATAYRTEVQRMQREHARRTMADALALARAHPSPSFRIALYRENRRAVSDLAKLGIPVEYVNPNAINEAAGAS